MNTSKFGSNGQAFYQLRNLATAFLIVCSVVAAIPAQAQDYDLVILNGRVMDPESGLDAVRNVGIKEDKIAVVTE